MRGILQEISVLRQSILRISPVYVQGNAQVKKSEHKTVAQI